MKHSELFKLIFGLIPVAVLALILLFFFFTFYLPRRRKSNVELAASESTTDPDRIESDCELVHEDLVCFQGGGDLHIPDILDAPGEVIGKSSYGTLYKATLIRDHVDSLVLLRFLRPACSASIKEVISVVNAVGLIRHPNLVPLHAFYVGPRGEKLLVYPFYNRGNLSEFIRDGNAESLKWEIIYKISYGIVKGLDHLHTGLNRQIIHGNLKSKNILLDSNYQPYLSDYGLHLLLNPTAGQEMLKTSAAQGYKAPELIKMKDVNETTDIYSLGVVVLELLTGKEPIDPNPSHSREFYLPDVIRSAILDHQIGDLYHPDLLTDLNSEQKLIAEDRILKLVQLAITCCSPSPSLRPHIKEVLRKLKEIGK
ncbi:hypothetical protein Nepgr_010605 [Nepenthes gracilis]|uniref:Protein kinase domain-containing protein n=1 Tax=Nepenthes gracilis TaxID=150966 RepID=A0AAD3SCN4_NEPGR|nr:hypothetical protein Nepgr_010605 [Nepenthes gracilis]